MMTKELLKPIIRIQKKVSRTLSQLSKEYRQAKAEYSHPRTILFIIGCQRSGTTMMTQILDKDLNAKVYGEFSKLSSHNSGEKLRLNPLESVKKTLEQDKPPFIILKPLVESQNAHELLNYFENSRALWMYRHYKDVASSNLKHFGLHNGINNLRPIVEGDPDNWRSQKISKTVRGTVLCHFSERMNPYDAAALFWYVRNSLLFDQGLEAHPRVMLCKYEDLVSSPRDSIKGIYEFAQQNFPKEAIFAESHRESLGKGKSIDLSPEVERLCESMWSKLNEVDQDRILHPIQENSGEVNDA